MLYKYPVHQYLKGHVLSEKTHAENQQIYRRNQSA